MEKPRVEIYHQGPSEMRCCPDGEAFVFEHPDWLVDDRPVQIRACLACDLNGHRPPQRKEQQ